MCEVMAEASEKLAKTFAGIAQAAREMEAGSVTWDSLTQAFVEAIRANNGCIDACGKLIDEGKVWCDSREVVIDLRAYRGAFEILIGEMLTSRRDWCFNMRDQVLELDREKLATWLVECAKAMDERVVELRELAAMWRRVKAG